MFEKTVLRVADVCQILNISQPTLYRWMAESKFPRSTKYGPRTIGWPRHVVEQWLGEKENPQTEQEQ